MSLFTILLGGDLTATARLRDQTAGSRVIAADSGMRHAPALGLVPELWTGDFDSVSDELRQAHGKVPVKVFPAEKDLTDGEIAVEAALERGATRLVLAGAFGGPRADHAFLHLAAAIRLAETGTQCLITSGDQEGHPILPGQHAIELPAGSLFSVVAFSDLTALSLSGVKWPLDRRNVSFGSSLTLSNEVTGRLEVGLEAGRALLVAHISR
jgi:thiamine pyrophosphokinase